MEACVVVVSCPPEKAEKISREVLKERVAACVNLLSGVRSLFWWEGRVEDSKETLLLIKTKRALLPRLERVVKRVHPYDVPEIIALPILYGNRAYLSWIYRETNKRKD